MPSSSSLQGTRHIDALNIFCVLVLFLHYLCTYAHVLRSKEVDWQPYFTTRLVDDFATHLRVFRKAQDRLADREDKQSKQTHSYSLVLSH